MLLWWTDHLKSLFVLIWISLFVSIESEFYFVGLKIYQEPRKKNKEQHMKRTKNQTLYFHFELCFQFLMAEFVALSYVVSSFSGTNW